MTDTRDKWAAGSTYEDFMGRWSRRLAPKFVSWLDAPSDQHWLDVGCGTGALTEAIKAHGNPGSVMACDPADPFVAFAREHNQDAHVSFVVAGVGALPPHPRGYGAVTSLFALNFFPNPGAAVKEMQGLAVPGGTISACVWDYAQGMEFLRRFWDIAVGLDPKARELDESIRFPLCNPESLGDLFREARLDDVRCEPIECATVFADFQDYWTPFLGGTGPAPSYLASLPREHQNDLAAELEATLPRHSDGSIALKARAWAVKGTVL